MAESVELHERATRVEQKVAEVHLMAVATDREVAAFRGTLHGHTNVLDALRETQVEHGGRLANLERKVDTGFDRMESTFAEVDARFDRMESAFTVLRVGQERITELLTAHLDDPGACEMSST